MVYLYIIIAILIVALILYLRSPKFKGKKGERKVSMLLRKIDGYLFNDYTILDKQGKTHQIDHILVSKKGIFVVETKNYSGRIYGSENQHQWTQVLQYGKVKHKLYNPIKQNKSHIYHLNQIIKNEMEIISCVVFVKGNTKYIEAEGVFSPKGLYRYIKKQPEKYEKEEVLKMTDIIMCNKELNVDNKKHVRQIKKTLKGVEKNICPRCGSKLVLRNSKYGKFYGCSNYPKCKFTKKN